MASTAKDKVQIVPCGSYDIWIGNGLLKEGTLVESIVQLMPNTSTFVILTDANVMPLYGQNLYEQFQKALRTPKRVLIHAIPPGEASKSREMKAWIEDHVFFHHRCHRDTCVIALGGGVVGDLSGYVAATYMRGVPFIQIPTSLLACVDSSIGGKTGIDVEEYGKNLIGAFHMPQRVFIDLSVLKTLPKRELVNGMAEVIKAGAIFNAELFDLLESSTDQILSLSDFDLLQKVVTMAVQVKATVVTEDVKEMGLRAILNFGHSIGHGIEALLQPAYLHGECVSMGMIKEAEIARGMGLCTSATVGRLRRCLSGYGLPVRVPDQVDTFEVLKKMEVDKKNSAGVKKIILLESIGQVMSNPYARAVKDEQIDLVLEKQVNVEPGLTAQGTIRVPGSKSISNRVLLLAALGQGTCRIRGLLHSDDTQVMMNALFKVGAQFEWEEKGSVLIVKGTGGHFKTLKHKEEIYLSNAGTAARFLTTTMTLVPSEGELIVTGNHRMKERPIGPLVDALNSNGCVLRYVETPGCPPVAVKPTGLAGGHMKLAAKVSSQYVSSVLLSAPYAKEPLVLELEEEHPTSLPYILMTIDLMKTFGIQVETLATNKYRIPTGVYKNPSTLEVEVDASSATYPMALAAITGGQVTVEALGVNSLQGDAAFHTLLRQMGCETSQDATTTTVKGPPKGQLLQAIDEIDMETMTDAFMTAVALAAVAKGKTKIVGIANQRVKECNRIEVMVTELTKLGVECGELEDGIWIQGTGGKVDHLKRTLVECHNDHRIAMSFAVLGAIVGHNVVITDKECTDKTYPEFWDHIQMHLGLKVSPAAYHAPSASSSTTSPTKRSGVFLIGMRGAGKSSLGKAAAEAMKWKLLDTDDLLVEQFGESIGEFVAKNGWEGFRSKQKDLMLKLLGNPPEETIISCGGGVVETKETVQALAKYPYVVHIHRAIEDVLAYLDADANRPSLGESHDSVWTRREPLYLQASSYEFTINKGDKDFQRVNKDFVQFLSVITANKYDLTPICHENSFFLSLTVPDVHQVTPSTLQEMTKDVDALELRVDLLAKNEDHGFIASQIATIRKILGPHLPIIFTVRSKNQGGQFVDDEKRIFPLLELGIRLGCELIDMECCWSFGSRENLITRRRHAAIVSSFHAIQKPTNAMEARAIFDQCYHQGKVDIVKVVLKSFQVQDAYMVHQVASSWGAERPIQIIALCTMEEGKLSRVLNRVLTPVTHPLLTTIAAPGQLNVQEIMSLRKTLGLLKQDTTKKTTTTRNFYLFGSPIQHSPSPAMHNAAFKATGLDNYLYRLYETSNIQEIVDNLLSDSHFGGASVTIPHKVAIVPFMNQLSDSAKAIGAVNTIIVKSNEKGERVLIGDNTDWLGILRPIKKRLPSTQKQYIALVVGAGGTSMAASYAMQQLGATLYVYNRTLLKAQEVAGRFGGHAIAELTPDTLERVDIVIGTIPADAGFVLPDYLLEEVKSKVIILDAAYKPPVTPMLAHASSKHKSRVFCIQGYEMLYEQAGEQFLRWCPHENTTKAPEEEMKQAVLQFIPVEQRL